MTRPAFFFLLICCQYMSSAQNKATEQISVQSDSILNLLIKETDNNKKADLIISFYSTSIDGFPLLLLNLSQKLLLAGRQRNDTYIESAAQSAAAQGYRLTGDYIKALEYHRKAIALAEQTENKVLLAFALNQMGHIYKDRLENEKALSLYLESSRLFEIGGRGDIWYPDMNLGAVYLNMAKYDSALYYATRGNIKMKKKGTVIGNQSNVYNTIANAYGRTQQPDSARKYFSLALDLVSSVYSARYVSSTYASIADYFDFVKQYDSAAYFNTKAVNAVTGTELNNLVLRPARKLTEYYQNINADSTVKYWKVYSAANDSVNNLRTNQQIQMLTFEEEQRKKDIEAAKIAYRNRIRMGLLLGGLAVFWLIAFILFRNNRQKQKANFALHEQKQKLESALQELKSTQAQLIQSEKMASLGELTAGIAHEIQNPLNFVNNFSEINAELSEEILEAADKGDLDEVKALATDIKSNQEKIREHGKRADSIVKGMLQHSRTSSGSKEPTNLNILCDEYLRLAYHGMQAIEKTFSCDIHTHFEPDLPKPTIIPQDIGRVILNLLNNAFYAVRERSLATGQSQDDSYKPSVEVCTKRADNSIEISIADNGYGIPPAIKDKIFQPFFTTKPTGQGTGLGLSLSYDIVTKGHGGELSADSAEGSGTRFTIKLPLQ